MKNASIAAIILTILGASIMVYAVVFLGNQDPESELPASESNEISLSMLQARKSPDRCWVAYSGRVFDISRLLMAKPEQTATWGQICGTNIDALPEGVKISSLTQYQIGILAP